jgi:uncharacterized lipoprotein YmbA
MLTPLPANETRKSEMRGLTIWIGPITLPQYTNRPQIITGNSGPEVQRAASALWAEPLHDNFARVLAENLSLLLATDRVALFPWPSPAPVDYQVAIEVTRFLGDLGGQVSLTAVWSLMGKNGKQVLLTRRSSFHEATGANGYEASAAAMSRNVGSLSREIAVSITALPQP